LWFLRRNKEMTLEEVYAEADAAYEDEIKEFEGVDGDELRTLLKAESEGDPDDELECDHEEREGDYS
jgi:hypothetical protein